jgi:hypothetical protein
MHTCVMRYCFKQPVCMWNSLPSRMKENRIEGFWNPSQKNMRISEILAVEMSESKVKNWRKLACAGLCNGLKTVRVVQDFAMDFTLCGLCRTLQWINTFRVVQDFATDWTLCGLSRILQWTEHCAACAGLCNVLNTVRVVQDFATD